jgi:DNA-binding LytR/AlgR family response regulator
LDLAFKINHLQAAPWIIFVTGMDKHALEAHDLHPVHYLLKPLDDTSVDKALDLVRKHQGKESLRFPIKHRFKGKRDFHLSFISRDEIICITKDKGEATVSIKLKQGEVLCDVTGTLAYWEKALDLTQVHRRHLINVAQAKTLSCQVKSRTLEPTERS